MRNLLERAKRSQAMRLMAMGGKRTKAELSTLTEADFTDSLAELRPRSGRTDGDGFGGASGGVGDEPEAGGYEEDEAYAPPPM